MHLCLHETSQLHAWGIQKNRLVSQCSDQIYKADQKNQYN